MSLSEDDRKIFEKELKDAETAGNAEIASTFESLVRDLEAAAGTKLKDARLALRWQTGKTPKFIAERATSFRLDHILDQVKNEAKQKEVEKVYASQVGQRGNGDRPA